MASSYFKNPKKGYEDFFIFLFCLVNPFHEFSRLHLFRRSSNTSLYVFDYFANCLLDLITQIFKSEYDLQQSFYTTMLILLLFQSINYENFSNGQKIHENFPNNISNCLTIQLYFLKFSIWGPLNYAFWENIL